MTQIIQDSVTHAENIAVIVAAGLPGGRAGSAELTVSILRLSIGEADIAETKTRPEEFMDEFRGDTGKLLREPPVLVSAQPGA